MTEDRLTQLFTEASDLTPSDRLRERVSPSPQPLASGRERGLGGASWFVLSGAAAALAVAAFALMPRAVSAAELIQRADRAVRQALTYRSERESFVKGAWKASGAFLHAPGWRLVTWPGGSFRLERPGALYQRDGLGPILMTHRFKPDPIEVGVEDDPSPKSYIRLLESQQGRLGPGRTTAEVADSPEGFREEKGRLLTESGRRLQEVIVTQARFPGQRTRFLIDPSTNLPARIETDRRVDGVWQGEWRVRFAYPGPDAGSEPFLRPLRSGRIVDVDAKGSKRSIG